MRDYNEVIANEIVNQFVRNGKFDIEFECETGLINVSGTLEVNTEMHYSYCNDYEPYSTTEGVYLYLNAVTMIDENDKETTLEIDEDYITEIVEDSFLN